MRSSGASHAVCLPCRNIRPRRSARWEWGVGCATTSLGRESATAVLLPDAGGWRLDPRLGACGHQVRLRGLRRKRSQRETFYGRAITAIIWDGLESSKRGGLSGFEWMLL